MRIKAVRLISLLVFALLAAALSAKVQAFRQTLRALGRIEGQNIFIEYRWAAGRPDRYSTLAEEQVRLKVDGVFGAEGRRTPFG